ncbi:hypothetical protein IL306_001461 [Fusarium sp. DS 682]|nr:hypothetical protein IL306_001461 [Fusarium sp. DS 682]
MCTLYKLNMNNTIGLAGSLGSKLAFKTVKSKLNKIGVEVLTKESDDVPKYMVVREASAIPEKWIGVREMPKEWLQAMMDIKPASNLVWIDPEDWEQKQKNQQGDKGKDGEDVEDAEDAEDGEDGEGGEEGDERESGKEARGKKRNSEDLMAEYEAAKAERKERERKEKERKEKDEKAEAERKEKERKEKDEKAEAERKEKERKERDEKAGDQAKAGDPAKADQPDITDTGAAAGWDKAQADKDPAEAGREKDSKDKRDERPEPPLKQESVERDIRSIPPVGTSNSPESPSPESSSTSPKSSTSASSGTSTATSASSSSKPASNAQPSGPSDTSSPRMMTPEQKDAEQEAISAVKKARDAQAELKKAEDEAMKAVDRAKSAGVQSVDYTSDELLAEDPTRFLIPAEYRDENTEAWGKIMYNTDNGFLLVYEKWDQFYRGYLFSGSEVAMKKKRFLENGGETLFCEPIIKSGGKKAPDIFETEIEAIAVMWRGGRVYRAMITLRDPGRPGKVLLYNITGLRAKYGQSNVAKRLRAEFLMRGQEPIWDMPRTTRVSKDETGYMAFLRKYGTAISKGKRAIQIVEIKKEDGDNEFELQEEELAVL